MSSFAAWGIRAEAADLLLLHHLVDRQYDLGRLAAEVRVSVLSGTAA